MSDSHRAEHQQSAGDYYAQTQQRLQQNAGHFAPEDRADAQKGVTAETQKEASAYSVLQGNQLLQDQSTRGDAPAPDQNYAASSHEDLYNMVHQGLNIEEINERSRVTNVYGNWLADASNAFRDAANTAGASWQGGAASQANSFFQNTASHTEQTGNAMQLVSNRYSQQSAAADYAQKNMPEPSKFNQQAEIEKATVQYATGDPAAGAQTMNAVAAKQQQAQADHDQAVQVMHGLDNTYHGTATTQPTYQPPPQPGAPDNSTQISSAQPGAGVGAHGTGVGGPGGSSYNPVGGQPGGGQPGGGPGGGTPGIGTGAGSSYAPPGSGVSSGAGNIGGTPGGGGTFRGPGVGGGGFGRVGPESVAMGGPTGGTGGGGGDITRSRPGIGTGRSGGGFAGSRVSGGGYKPGEVEEPGKGTGAGKGAAERLERGATAAANAGKAGKAGEAGAAGNAAGKKKEEDKEHKNKIPTQADPDEVFEVRPERGPDGEKITPPVIGG